MNDYDFTIPLENIVYSTKDSYCQTQIALLPKTDNAIILGGAFFTAFTGMFDIENDRIGFAESTNALAGSSIRCTGNSCIEPIALIGLGTDEIASQNNPGHKSYLNLILVVFVPVIVTAIVFGGIFLYKKKSSRKDNAQVKECTRGKIGYGLADEKEDDENDDQRSYAATTKSQL